MPVSLSEWRVRIGTFVHWIREYEVKERRERLLKERIRRLKVLCKRLEEKMGHSGEESEDDKSRQDGPDPKGCPHKTANIRSSGNSSDIKDLLTSCDQCIQELFTASDSHIKEILTPSDTCIKQLLTPRRESLERIQRLKVLCERLEAKMGDSGEESEDDNSRQDGSDPKGCPHKTANIRSSGNSSDIKDSLTSCDQCIQDLLTARDSHIKEILTPSCCSIKEFITPNDCSIKELITPNDCSIKSPNTLNGSTIKDVITANDSGIKELLMTNDSEIQILVGANDASRIQDLVKSHDDSRIQELLKKNYSSIRDPITPKYCSIKEVIVSKNDSTKLLDIPNASSIKDLITPNDSSIIGLITSEYYNVKDLITSNDSKVNSLLTPNETNIKRLMKPDDDYIEDQLAQDYDYVKTCTSDDESIEQDRQVGDLEEQQMSDFSISPRHSLSDASLRELLTSYPSTKDLRTPTDYSNTDLLIQTSYIIDHETQSDGSVKELSSQGSQTTVCQPFAPCEDFLVELLKPTVYASKDVPSIDLCCHEPDRRNEPFSEESGKLPHFVGKEQHPQPDTFTKEATDDELLKEHRTSAGSCKKSQTETSILMAVKCSPVVPFVSRKNCISDRYGEKQMRESASSCHGPPLKSKTDLISGQIPPLSELLLLKSGDVELNPGPREAAWWSLEIERELLSLVEDISPKYYTRLCNALDVSYARSQAILTKNLLDVSNALFEVICSWGIKQRDGTNYKRLLAEKLRSVHLDSVGTKLVEGGYSTQDIPTQWAEDRQDTPQPVVDMSEDEVIQCGEDFKNFYREHLCKIKPDPFDFQSLREFEQIYTKLVLQRGNMTKTKLDYSALLTTTVNGVLPKRFLIEGEGGVGKTTFCSKIAWDWIKGSPEFQRFSWVLVIPLREVVKGQTIGDIMKDYLPENNSVSPKQINNYILSQPTKVLIVLDGLDEYDEELSAKESSDISQILRLEKFKECIVLVTTRPWRAYQIKSNKELSKSYAFIAVEGFSAENVSKYISKYFVDDVTTGLELIRFIEVNDVIKENMAPFPIYVAMLCILWENCDSEKREKIRKLKTFFQLFDQMILFLGDHYVSKVTEMLSEAHLDKEMEIIKLCLQKIGSIAFSGLLKRKLVFTEEDFCSCKEAMETCCKIGVLSRNNQNVSRWKRTLTASQPIITNVFFPHKLFQEYIASVFLASLYDTNREEYSRSIGGVLSDNPQEFRYLLYFTAALGKEVGLDIVKKIQPNVQQGRMNNDFLVDVTFEAYNKETAKAVGQRIFADEKMLTVNRDMPAHTVSGYLFIMEQHGMENLVFRNRSFGQTVSSDLADVLLTSNSLSRLEFYLTSLHHDFYQGDKSSITELVIDHQFLNGLQTFNEGDINVTIGDLFPSLTQLTFTTLHTVSPAVVERLAHSRLAVLCIENGKKGKDLVLLIGEPTSLGQLFFSSFPQLTCLTFRGLVMGNIRSEAILCNLKNHLHLKSISIISCFTDNELDPLAEQITTENRMKITLKHNMKQESITFEDQDRQSKQMSWLLGRSTFGPLTVDIVDALCHRTCVRCLKIRKMGVNIASDERFPDLYGRDVDSKIQTIEVYSLKRRDDQSASYFLGKFLSLLPHLTDLNISSCSLHDDFFTELADRASSSQIQTLKVYDLMLCADQSASYFLGKFLSLLPHLTDLDIRGGSFHEDFYKEIADQASSSQIQTFNAYRLSLRTDQSASYFLGKFLSLLPHLTDLEITSCSFHEDFYKEIADQASSSQIQTLKVCRLVVDWRDQLSSCFLGKFISVLPHLTDLMINRCFFHEEFLEQIADQASSYQIQTFKCYKMYLRHDQSASSCMGKFLGLMPHLTDLNIHKCTFHDDFYKGIADQASSSQLQKLEFYKLKLRDDQTASYCLRKFLSLLPHLTDLTIYASSFHDTFYKQIADYASLSQIQTLKVDSFDLGYDQSTSYCLGKFLSLLPHLTDLTICSSSFNDDLYKEFADCASSSQIQTVNLDYNCNKVSISACKQLAKFLCSLPCLTTLETNMEGGSYLNFCTEVDSLAASSQSPYFRETYTKRQVWYYCDIPSTSGMGFYT